MGRFLVDGMNVLGSRPDGWWRDRPAAVAALVDRLGAWAVATGEDVAVVFDGDPPPGLDARPPGSITVVFTGRGTSADDEIARRVEGDRQPSDLCVVTSDSDLAARVRGSGAAVTGSGGFRRRLDEGPS